MSGGRDSSMMTKPLIGEISCGGSGGTNKVSSGGSYSPGSLQPGCKYTIDDIESINIAFTIVFSNFMVFNLSHYIYLCEKIVKNFISSSIYVLLDSCGHMGSNPFDSSGLATSRKSLIV